MNFLMLLVVLTGIGTAPDFTSSYDQKLGNAEKKEETACWHGEPETQNQNVGKRRPTRLPPDLANAKVRRSVVLLKLCISETGDVARVIVLRSSGNADIDRFYCKELQKWTFTPVLRNNKKARSVLPVTVTLYLK